MATSVGTLYVNITAGLNDLKRSLATGAKLIKQF
jgi:hypothetical protein